MEQIVGFIESKIDTNPPMRLSPRRESPGTDMGRHLKSHVVLHTNRSLCYLQRLAGCTLLVFANKQDLPGALTAQEIREVSQFIVSPLSMLGSTSGLLCPHCFVD